MWLLAREGADELQGAKTTLWKTAATIPLPPAILVTRRQVSSVKPAPPAEVNLSPVLCLGPRTSWVRFHGAGQCWAGKGTHHLPHNPAMRTWAEGSSIVPS